LDFPAFSVGAVNNPFLPQISHSAFSLLIASVVRDYSVLLAPSVQVPRVLLVLTRRDMMAAYYCSPDG